MHWVLRYLRINFNVIIFSREKYILQNLVYMFLHTYTKHKSIQYNHYQFHLRPRYRCFVFINVGHDVPDSSLQQVSGAVDMFVAFPLNADPEVVAHQKT